MLTGDNDVREGVQPACPYHQSYKTRAGLLTGAGRILALHSVNTQQMYPEVVQGPTVLKDQCLRCKRGNFLLNALAYALEFAYYDTTGSQPEG